MIQRVPFTKMHGLGNDFVIIDDLKAETFASSQTKVQDFATQFAQKICNRRLGVGADQVLWLKKPINGPINGLGSHDARMEILNADGSVAEMCGNGIRAVALYLNRHSAVSKLQYRIETLAGTQIVNLVENDEVKVDMGRPGLGNRSTEGELLSILSKGKTREFRFYEVSMGNPHAVIFMDQISEGIPEASLLEEIGPLIETHSRFPKRTNVEFVKILSSTKIQVRVWERGAGATLACGTGACAAAVASILTGRTQSLVEAALPGGNLQIEWQKGSSHVLMKGPATEVFQGTYLFEL